MFYTLKDAYDISARFIENGTCDTAVAYGRINEAVRRISEMEIAHPHMVRTIRIYVDNHVFPLPREVEKIYKVNFCGQPGNVFSKYHEYLSVGPGDLDLRTASSGYKDLIDMGDYPVMYDIPVTLTYADDVTSVAKGTYGPGFQLAAFSTHKDDTSLALTLRGVTITNDEIRTDGIFGEQVSINMWGGGVEGTITGALSSKQLTTSLFKQVQHVIKPVTKGYVCLYAVDATTNYMYFLGKYHPDDQHPSFKRYKIMNEACTSDSANIQALVKLRYIPMTQEDDMLLIQQPDAVKLMVMSIEAENKGDMQTAVLYESKASQVLSRHQMAKELTGTMIAVIDVESQICGSRVNQGLIL